MKKRAAPGWHQHRPTQEGVGKEPTALLYAWTMPRNFEKGTASAAGSPTSASNAPLIVQDQENRAEREAEHQAEENRYHKELRISPPDSSVESGEEHDANKIRKRVTVRADAHAFTMRPPWICAIQGRPGFVPGDSPGVPILFEWIISPRAG